MPAELEDLFTSMVGQRETVYQLEGSHIFLVMLKFMPPPTNDSDDANTMMPALKFSFTSEDFETVLQSTVQCLTQEEAEQRIARLDIRLKVRCAGLLEVPQYRTQIDMEGTGQRRFGRIGGVTVQWLHRTVKDFLKSEKGRKQLVNSIDHHDFTPSMALLAGSLMHLKKWFPNMEVSEGVLPALVNQAMSYAYEAEFETHDSDVRLIQDFDTTVSKPDWLKSTNECFVAWGITSPRLLARRYNLRCYLWKILHEPVESLTPTPADHHLGDIVWCCPSSSFAIGARFGRELGRYITTLETLLEAGQSLDMRIEEKHEMSVYQSLLCEIKAVSPIKKHSVIWPAIIESLLNHTSSQDTVIIEGHEYDVKDIIREAFTTTDTETCRRLLAIAELKASSGGIQPVKTKRARWLRRIFLTRRC